MHRILENLPNTQTIPCTIVQNALVACISRDAEANLRENRRELVISEDNRKTLLRMLDFPYTGKEAVRRDSIVSLIDTLQLFLEKHMADQPAGHLWIILSCVYLSMVVREPMDPQRFTHWYLDRDTYCCPAKEETPGSVCLWCVCKSEKPEPQNMNAKRGYVPEDERNFSPTALETMRTASRHINYLINEGYDLKQASTFVGNHFLLSERQRLAIMRSLATREQLAERSAKKNARGNEVWIDGFNTIITLEVMLSDSILFSCMDGTIRDLASLRGTYRIIPETREAVQILFDMLRKMQVETVHVLLDAPVSNSGRLKALMADAGENYPFSLDIQIQKNVDRELYGKENVISSDSVILDHCKSWLNVTARCAEQKGIAVIRVWELTGRGKA